MDVDYSHSDDDSNVTWQRYHRNAIIGMAFINVGECELLLALFSPSPDGLIIESIKFPLISFLFWLFFWDAQVLR